MKAFKLINGRYLLVLSLAVFLGAVFSYLVYFKGAPKMLWLSSFVFFIFLLFKKERIIWQTVIISLAILLFLTSYLLFANKAAKLKNQPSAPFMTRVEGTVKKVAPTDFGFVLILNKVTFNGVKTPNYLKMYVDGGSFEIGDMLGVGMFVKSAYLEGDISPLVNGILYKGNANFQNIEKLGIDSNMFLKIRRIITQTLHNNLSDQNASIGEALLTGDTSFMEEGLLNNFRYGGVAHIFSVSGLHIATLAGALILIFKKVRYKNFLKPLLITSLLLAFSAVVGFSASSVRASVMCGFFLFAKSLGKRKDGLNSLLLAFIVVVLINPASLWDIGFKLSFLAVFFIIILSYPLKRLFACLPKKIASPLNVSLSASIGTLPVTCDSFGFMPLLSLLLNLIFVPLISLVFSLLFFSVILTLIVPYLSFVFVASNFLLKVSQVVFSAFDYAILTLPNLRFGVSAMFFYTIFIFLSDKLNLNKRARLVLSMASVTLFLVFFCIINC